MSLSMQMPERVIVHEHSTQNHGIFILQPLEGGYGVTIGNSFRRVLLSSIPGAAIVAVRVSGVLHEFQTIPGVVEDMCEIILNLKGVRLKIMDKKGVQVAFRLKGPHTFTAKDIQTASDQVEIMNPDHYIATLAHDADVEIELIIGRGKGYVPADENRDPDYPVNTIPIDAIFTPIKNVKYSVEPFRVGQKTDYERLTIDVETDGTISAEEAMEQAARILRDHIQLFINFDVEEEPEAEDESRDAEFARIRRILNTPVDDLELSVRSHNCLKAANIKTLADLVRRQESDMLKFRNFGRKSLAELTEIVQQFNLHFGMDVDKYLQEDEKQPAED
ncbi:MAG: DNA-directed RNA polymerase subunit alpha [Candidatus Kapabacteria bacterium]|nr:DNA-directed RNA polymerase subunit alpha [Candidatus Kapabacteria bacterium]